MLPVDPSFIVIIVGLAFVAIVYSAIVYAIYHFDVLKKK